MKKANPIILFLILGIISSCDKIMLEEELPDNPVSNFDFLWDDFDRRYGLFNVKKINWDSLYSVYSPMLEMSSTDGELYEVMTSLLSNLDDKHVYLRPTNSELEKYNSGGYGNIKGYEIFDYEIVQDNYLSESIMYSQSIYYGKLPDNIGYIYIANMFENQRHYEKAMKEILSYLESSEAIIIDVRNNSGGWLRTVNTIGGRFFSEKLVFELEKKRNGPGHNDFTTQTEYYIEPRGDFQYLKQIVLLSNRKTISAGEGFLLGMKRRDNVIHIGDTTAGAFSFTLTRELPNGWLYAISVSDARDYNNVSWEGIGLPPDIVVKNDTEELENGIDNILESAIEYLYN